jgi:hypothetical protein
MQVSAVPWTRIERYAAPDRAIRAAQAHLCCLVVFSCVLSHDVLPFVNAGCRRVNDATSILHDMYLQKQPENPTCLSHEESEQSYELRCSCSRCLALLGNSAVRWSTASIKILDTSHSFRSFLDSGRPFACIISSESRQEALRCVTLCLLSTKKI